MAEPAKKQEGHVGGLPRVQQLKVKDAVEFPPAPAQTTLTLARETQRPAIGPMPILDMVLDRQMGGVLVRYRHREETCLYLIPLSNISAMKMAE